VRIWPYRNRRLDTGDGAMRTLRWPAWREQLGGIKALALSPDGTHVAVGGSGLTPSAVALIRHATGELVSVTYPQETNGRSFGSVTAIGFHPNGKHIGFGTRMGDLWLWDSTPLPKPDSDGRSAAPPVRVGKFTPRKRAGDAQPFEFNEPRVIDFPIANRMLSLAESGEALTFDITAVLAGVPGAIPKATDRYYLTAENAPKTDEVYKAIRSPDGKWLAIAFHDRQFGVCTADFTKGVRPITSPAAWPSTRNRGGSRSASGFPRRARRGTPPSS